MALSEFGGSEEPAPHSSFTNRVFDAVISVPGRRRAMRREAGGTWVVGGSCRHYAPH